MSGVDTTFDFFRYKCGLVFFGGRLLNPLPSGQYFISVITEIELLSYSSLSLEEETEIIDFLNKITLVGIDSNIKNLTISLRKKYKLLLPDAIIVATAKSLNATLFTNDVKLANLTKFNTQKVQIV